MQVTPYVNNIYHINKHNKHYILIWISSNPANPAYDAINKCKEARIHNKTYRTFSYKHVRASALVFVLKPYAHRVHVSMKNLLNFATQTSIHHFLWIVSKLLVCFGNFFQLHLCHFIKRGQTFLPKRY